MRSCSTKPHSSHNFAGLMAYFATTCTHPRLGLRLSQLCPGSGLAADTLPRIRVGDFPLQSSFYPAICLVFVLHFVFSCFLLAAFVA